MSFCCCCCCCCCLYIPVCMLTDPFSLVFALMIPSGSTFSSVPLLPSVYSAAQPNLYGRVAGLLAARQETLYYLYLVTEQGFQLKVSLQTLVDSLVGTRIREYRLMSTRFNSPSLYKYMQVTPVNRNILRRSPGVPINRVYLYIYLIG